MKVVAALFADFRESFLGGASQLETRLGARSVLQHALARLARVDGLDARYVIVRTEDERMAGERVRDFKGVEVAAIDDGVRSRRGLIRSARKWNLESWRGGALGTTWFDEFVDARAVARVFQHSDADAVLCLEGHMPALDPLIATRMIAHLRENAGEANFVFTQAPPGLAGVLVRRDFLAELLEQQWPLGLVLSYRPEFPRGDLITRPMCCRVNPAISQTAGRFTGDTRRSRELLSEAFAELGEDCDALALCQWSRRPGNERAGTLPVEVELELTTDDPLPETRLRPRGARVPQRGPVEVEAVSRVARELAAYDDRLLVLGGHGDPLRHPTFIEICRAIRAAGVYGVCVATPLVELSDETASSLLEARVDAVEVLLDADTRDRYERAHGFDGFERVLANIERIEAARQAAKCPQPIVVPSITRCTATQAEIEPFFDRWIARLGWAVIRGYGRYAGTLPADELLAMTPPVREPCRRLGSRLMLLADGRAVACNEDVAGTNTLGRWDREPLAEIWRSTSRDALREAHSQLSLKTFPVCGRVYRVVPAVTGRLDATLRAAGYFRRRGTHSRLF